MVERHLFVSHKKFQLRKPFVISRASKAIATTIQVIIQSADNVGRGECVPYPRYGETEEKVITEIESVRKDVQNEVSTDELQTILPAGPARAALDAALWDLKAKQSKIPVWQLAGIPRPTSKETAVTLTLDDPLSMAKVAKQIRGNILKLKLGASNDLERVSVVHEARPDANLILDGNEGMTEEAFNEISQRAKNLNVVMIEQPYPEANDKSLVRVKESVAICADESAHTSNDITNLANRYDFVNIKLDKTGGFTEAIKMIRRARDENMGVMLGCMVASSLSMAPAMTLSALADYIDLDGPLWLKNDVKHGLEYKDSYIDPPNPKLWG